MASFTAEYSVLSSLIGLLISYSNSWRFGAPEVHIANKLHCSSRLQINSILPIIFSLIGVEIATNDVSWWWSPLRTCESSHFMQNPLILSVRDKSEIIAGHLSRARASCGLYKLYLLSPDGKRFPLGCAVTTAASQVERRLE